MTRIMHEDEAGALTIAGPAGSEAAGARIVRLDAEAIVDGQGLRLAPGSLLVERSGDSPGPSVSELGDLADSPMLRQRTLDVGTPEAIDRRLQELRPDSVTTLFAGSGRVVLPAFVNAHAHLDLTHAGCRAFEPAHGFAGWARMVRDLRRTDEAGIRDSVREGVRLSLAGGVMAVGDIAGAPPGMLSRAPFDELAVSGLGGVSFLEFFGIGRSAPGAIDRVRALSEAVVAPGVPGPVRFGLQPHAPNTVDLRVYEQAAALAASMGLPLSTHLAETPEEREFIAEGTGPQRELLERLGLWDDRVLECLGHGRHPVEHVQPVLERARWLVAHANDCPDNAIPILVATGTSVAYCPRASACFGADRTFGPHRYLELLAAGVGVCLGTDSIISLGGSELVPADAAGRLSTLDEARLLWHRDRLGAPAQGFAAMLLAMAGVNGARALGLDERAFAFVAGAPLAGLVLVDVGGVSGQPEVDVLSSWSRPELFLSCRNSCVLAGTAPGRSDG